MQNPLINLHQFIVEHYDREELRTLCFDLGVEYDDLGGEGRSDKVRELLRRMGRRRALEQLVDALRRGRPGTFDEASLGLSGGVEALYAALPTYEQAVDPALSLLRRISLSLWLVGGSGFLIVVLVFAFLLQRPGDDAPTSTPGPPSLQIDDDALRAIGNLRDITALAMGDGAELWVGAVADTQYVLYRLDTEQAVKADPRPIAGVNDRIASLVEDCAKDRCGKINEIVVDRKGNVWLLLNQLGTLVYQPGEGELDTLINAETSGGMLTYDTPYAIATRFIDEEGAVEVWLGRKGVRTLRYDTDYPSLDTNLFLASDRDGGVWERTEDFIKVQALRYVTPALWVADNSSHHLLPVIPYGTERTAQDFSGSIWSLSNWQDVVWAMSDRYLIKIQSGSVEPISLDDRGGVAFNGRAGAVAAGDKWVWFGGDCGKDEACRPLGVYGLDQDEFYALELGQDINEVRGIVIDPSGAVWIGTNKNLFIYPQSE